MQKLDGEIKVTTVEVVRLSSLFMIIFATLQILGTPGLFYQVKEEINVTK